MIGSGLWSGAPVASDHNLCVHFLCTETVNNMGYFFLECRSYLNKLGTLILVPVFLAELLGYFKATYFVASTDMIGVS